MATLDQLDRKIIVQLINQLKGKSTEEERKFIRNWLNEREENKRLYDELSDIWNATVKKDQLVINSPEALKKVKFRIGQNSGSPYLKTENTRPYQRVVYNLLKVAAIFIIAFLTGILFNRLVSREDIATKSTMTEIVAPIGSKSQIILPDSTKVWLNAGSILRFDSRFNQKDRIVSLEGEAFFDVTKKNGKLFRVETKGITIRVLGTAFNVKAYPNEGSIETTLVHGSLIIEQHAEGKKITETMLEPNQRAIFIKKEGNLFLSEVEKKSLKHERIKKIESIKEKIILSKQVDTEVYTAWKDNRLIFRNEIFESLAIKLERWYGVKIDIKDEEIKKYHFNGTIVNETIQDVMEIIKYTLPINYSIEHNIITIQKNIKK
jgi:ferric-dicitrate binding protein FerR (iron transport regulator)